MNMLGIDCILFEICNINCVHCFQLHQDSFPTKEYFEDFINKLRIATQEEIEKRNPDLIGLSIRGGELFYDNIPDEFFDYYLKVVNTIKEFNLPINIDFVSNGIYTKHDRLLDLLEKTNAKVSLSYDSCGRFTNETKKLFIKTCDLLVKENRLLDVSITLTKPTIKKYINNEDDWLISSKLPIDINYYLPSKNWETLFPSDDDLYLFYKWIVDNELFQVIYLSDILDNELEPKFKIQESCGCQNRFIFDRGIKTNKCTQYFLSVSNFNTQMTEDNYTIMDSKKGRIKRGCYCCEYNNNCKKECWTAFNFNKNTSICPHKRIRQYIKEKPDLLQHYKEWKNA